MNANTGKPVIEPLDGGPLPSLKGYHMPLGRTPLGGYGGSTVVANNNNNNNNNSKSNSNNSTHSGNNNSTNLNISSSNNSSGRVGVGPQPRLKPSSYHHPRSVPRGNVRVAPFPPDDRLPHSPLSGGNSRTGSTNPRGRLPPHGHNNNTTTVTFTSRRTAASEVAAPGPLMANTGRSSKDGRGLVNSASASATMNATNASNSTTRNCTLPSLPPPSVTSAETQGTTLYGESNASNSPLTMYSSTTVATTPHHHNTHKLANSQHQQQPTASAAATYSLHNLSRYEEEEVRQFLPEVYFTGLPKDKKVAADKSIPKNCGFDDENDHYVIHNGDHIAYRYEIVKELGRGTFGVVVRAIDHKTKQQVAIKIVKNRTAYTKQAKEEASFLERLVRDDPEDSQNIVRLVQTLMFRDHYILVFELLDKDVYRVIQLNKYRPMQMSYIFDFADQVLTALRFIASHRIIHCDIKPENIVMDSTNPSLTSSQPRLKIIDFGSSCNEDNRVFTYIQSRYYRAPEIVLGIPYTTAIDMWSFGCVLCELANGYPIFPASSEGELLERMTEYFGDFPDHLVRQGKRASKFFSLGDQCAMLPNLSRKGRRCHGAHARRLTHFLKSSFSERDGLFADFVGRCLKYDPTQRMTAVEAMKHPWIVRGRSPYQ